MLSIIILAGGRGTRFGSDLPKQFLDLNGKSVISYSIDFFQSLNFKKEIIVVCAPEYRHYFQGDFIFAEPGERRQDSTFNGLKYASFPFTCIHDGVRPNINPQNFDRCFAEAQKYGAAALAAPVKNTIKEAKNGFVIRTLDRQNLFEAHTPQIIRTDLLKKGFAAATDITVTDDIALMELINHPAKLVPDIPENIKITTPLDLELLKKLI